MKWDALSQNIYYKSSLVPCKGLASKIRFCKFMIVSRIPAADCVLDPVYIPESKKPEKYSITKKDAK